MVPDRRLRQGCSQQGIEGCSLLWREFGQGHPQVIGMEGDGSAARRIGTVAPFTMLDKELIIVQAEP